jgi:integrase
MGVRLRQRRTGWQTVICHERQRRYGKTFPTKRDAEQFARDQRQEMVRRDFAMPRRDVPTVGALAAVWLKTAALDRRPGTLDNYAAFLDDYLLPAFGSEPVTTLTSKALREWIGRLRAPGGQVRWADRGLAPGTLRIGLAAVRMILDDAVFDGLLPVNPLTALGRIVGRVTKKPIDPFDPAELAALFTAAETLDATGAWAVRLRMFAGAVARVGETAAWRWEGLDLDAGTIATTETYSHERLGPPKTGSSVRVSSFLHPVGEPTAGWEPGGTAECAALLHRLKVLKLASAGPYMFGGARPAKRMDPRWKRTCTLAGVRYRNPENLRHSGASILLSRGAPLLYVQSVGGWATATVLLQKYAKWIPSARSAPPARQEPLPGAGSAAKSL